MKRIGPELKKPNLKSIDVKVPAVARDLYQDLRDRRLLPLVALILVAIVAAPILLSGSGSDSSSSPAAPSVTGLAPSPAATASNASLTVVKAAPGLREPSKRLSRLHAKDPFRQHYTNAPVTREATPVEPTASSTVTSETSTTEVTSEESTEPPASGAPGETGGSSPGNGGNPGAPGKGDFVFYAFAVDVKIVRTETKPDGSKKSEELPAREGVLPPTPLPGEKTPVVTYLGVGAGAKTALLMISKDVTAVFGDGKCVSGTDSCELLEVETGIPSTFEYGPNHVRYKINVLKIVPVVAGHS